MKTLLIFTLGVQLGCSVSKKPFDHDTGLDHFDLNLTSENLALLRSHANLEDYVALEIDWNQKGYTRGLISHTGKSSLHHYKRSFEVKLSGNTKFYALDKLRLSSQGSDPSQLRSYLGFYVFNKAGVFAPKIIPATLAINDEWQGLYHTIEAIDDDFYKRRNVLIEKLYKAQYGRPGYASFSMESLADLKSGFEIKKGDDSYDDLSKFISLLHRQHPPISAAEVQDLFDIDSYIQYIAVSVYLDHWDGFKNNYYLYRQKNSPRFAVTAWDVDKILNDTPYIPLKSIWGDNELCRILFSIPSIKARYLVILKLLVEKTAPFDELSQILTMRAQILERAYASDPYLSALKKNQAQETELVLLRLKTRREQILKDLTSLGFF